jgi:hypothetical protein
MTEEEQTKIENRLNAKSLDNFFRFNTKSAGILARFNNYKETKEEEEIEDIPFSMHIIQPKPIYE